MLHFQNAHSIINTTNIAIPLHDEVGFLDQFHAELP